MPEPVCSRCGTPPTPGNLLAAKPGGPEDEYLCCGCEWVVRMHLRVAGEMPYRMTAGDVIQAALQGRFILPELTVVAAE